ncbi:AEC family transporter [Malikia sp.]|uniref:AEC family transporter n=1 Tax=Malikia sp. TaxID=2070706 RepID=UPI0026129C5B|nr:AEC family transporter [Malikia sp.]MDD2727665.1 AEC family transporter [Malikia sp.]
MLHILSITSPIFLLIAVGYLAVWRGLFKREDMLVLGKLLVDFLLPALVCRAITQFPLQEVLNLRYLAVYGTGSAVALLAGVLYGRWRHMAWPRAALTGMGMSASNTIFVGFPIVSELIGPGAAIAMTLGVLVENLLVVPVMLLLAGRDASLPWQRSLAQSLRTLARNPIIWAIAAGVACSALELKLPYVLDRSLQIVGSAATGVALLMIGGVLVGQRLQGMQLDLPVVVGGKLLLHPLCVLAALALLPAVAPELHQAAILYACMPMPALFSALAQRLGHGGYAATLLVASTVVAFFSVNAWIWVVMHGLG